MLEKDPTTWNYATWTLAIGMSCAGGLINFYARIKQGHVRAFNIVELVGEIFISAFVGLGVFMTAQSLDQPTGLCAALAGLGGHMATRLLFLVERAIENRIRGIGVKK